jgi:hypothetical protein
MLSMEERDRHGKLMPGRSRHRSIECFKAWGRRRGSDDWVTITRRIGTQGRHRSLGGAFEPIASGWAHEPWSHHEEHGHA